MKFSHRHSFAVLAVWGLSLLCFTSCLKDEDKDLFSKPFVISGEMDPNIGTPIANAELNITDLLGMLQSFEAYVNVDPATNQLTVSYDTVVSNVIPFGSSKSACRSSVVRNAGENIRLVTPFTGVIDIDLFQNIELLDNVSFQEIYTSLVSDILINATDQMAELIEVHHVLAYIDSLQFVAYGADPSDSLALDIQDNRISIQPQRTQTLTILDNSDISPLVNISPRKIRYRADLVIEVPPTEMMTIVTMTDFVADSLTIRSIHMDNHIDIHFPMSMCMRDLQYSFATPLSLGGGLDSILSGVASGSIRADLDTASLIIKATNGIPFSILLNCNMLDADSNVLFPLTQSASPIQGAPVQPADFNPSVYVASGTQTSYITVPLDQTRLEKLGQVAYFELNANLSSTGADANQTISLRADDRLGLELFLKINPHLSFNIPLGGDDDDDDDNDNDK